ncbi:unnamed protein product, partial [Polarella glacialis]
SECVPLIPETGEIDSVRLVANILAGLIIGIRQALSAIVSATLVFTGSHHVALSEMFPFGISMMWYSTLVGSAFYCVFGRLQYNTNATQEVCAILYGAMAQRAAVQLRDTPERIPATVLALIMTSTVLTGLCSVLLGKLGVGSLMLRFPAPVTSGFLGTIGFFLVRTALQVSSGVEFQYFYPVSFQAFCSVESLAPVTCLLLMVGLMRYGPAQLMRLFPDNKLVKMLGGLSCQLLPPLLFYLVIWVCHISMDTLSRENWTYPAQGGHDFMSLWTSYSLRDADWGLVVSSLPSMLSLVLISVLCTMTGVIGIIGPDGDPSPLEVLDFDAELTTVGWAAILLGLTNGVVTFHRLGSSVQLRMDGGTHRIGVLTSSLFVGAFFFSNLPLGHYIPKWFLGGLFMGSGISFLEGSFLSYRSLPPLGRSFLGVPLPSPQYWVTVTCILVAAASSPFQGIGVGVLLSIIIFLWESAQSSPVASMSDGSRTVSRTMRPVWELRTLRREGDRTVLLYLQGHIFFGSGQQLASSLVEAVEGLEESCDGPGGHVEYCILSFAKVPSIDASAAGQLQSAVKRIARHGCKVLCCRMNHAVFDALSAAKIVQSPDGDLRRVLGITSDMESSEDNNEEPEDASPASADTPSMHVTLHGQWRRQKSFRLLTSGDHDAFDQMTDALDFSGDLILGKFCYGKGSGVAPVATEPYMSAYRSACVTGRRLSDDAFEQMNLLPP